MTYVDAVAACNDPPRVGLGRQRARAEARELNHDDPQVEDTARRSGQGRLYRYWPPEMQKGS